MNDAEASDVLRVEADEDGSARVVEVVSGTVHTGRTLAAGRASGEAVVLEAPLSLWGGLDPEDGRIIDGHHPQHGVVVTGRVVVMPGGRGSSSSSSVLAEAIRLGTAPAALVLGTADPILAVGALVAAELYGTSCPVVVLDGPATGLERGPMARGWTRGDSNP